MRVPNFSKRMLYAAATIFITCVTAVTPNEIGQTLRNVEVMGNALYDQCATEDSTYTKGSCMLEQECDYIGGTASGTCAEGLGACCIVKKSCNSATSLNNTYFVNPSSVDTRLQDICALTINRANADICQIRLDFMELQLSQPDGDGHCSEDFLAITGEMATLVPTICGQNDGQHMYVDVEPNGGALNLAVDLSSTYSKTWKIHIQQIACDSRYRAPDGCLQYHTDTAGTVKSFNYNPEIVEEDFGTAQISDHNYGICIKKASGYCGIIWERDQGSQYSFTVSEDTRASNPDYIGTPAACTRDKNCEEDHVIIAGGVDDEGQQSDRYCGLGFPDSVTSTEAPFVLHVRTNSDEIHDGGNSGFLLHYRQTVSC